MQKALRILKSNTFSSLLGNGVSALLGLFVFALIARNLSKEHMGHWQIFLACFSIVDVIRTGLLLNGLITRLAAAKTEEAKSAILGSAWYLAWTSSLLILVLSGIAVTILYFSHSSTELLLLIGITLPLAALISLPGMMATYTLNAEGKIKLMIWIRLISQFIFLGGLFLYGNYDLVSVSFWFIFGYLISGFISLLFRWVKPRQIIYRSKEVIKDLGYFGRYSAGTLIGSSLLRSSDIFLLGAFIGPAGVAIYSVAQRMVELAEMPVRSFAVANMPVLAHLKEHAGKNNFRKEFEKRSGVLILIVFPICLFCFLFPEFVVTLLGGEQYRSSAALLRLFAIYMVFMPFERFSGIGLDILNMPERNFLKVMLMLAVNVAGDILVIHIFVNNPVWWVAFISIITYGTGIIYGYRLLYRENRINPWRSVTAGAKFILETSGIRK